MPNRALHVETYTMNGHETVCPACNFHPWPCPPVAELAETAESNASLASVFGIRAKPTHPCTVTDCAGTAYLVTVHTGDELVFEFAYHCPTHGGWWNTSGKPVTVTQVRQEPRHD